MCNQDMIVIMMSLMADAIVHRQKTKIVHEDFPHCACPTVRVEMRADKSMTCDVFVANVHGRCV